MYEHGLGMPADRVQALEWYRKASAGGSGDGQADFARLSKGG
jgi:TPR repeat protein